MSRRDKDATRATEIDDASDPHRDIPKDAKGEPIFLVLPDQMRARYERRLTQCEAGWRASHDPAFVSEAQILTHLHRQPPALWLSEAVIELAARRRTKGDATRILNNAIRQLRYKAVREAKAKPGTSWNAAYAAASEALAGTGAAGEPRTMKGAYRDVNNDRKNARGARYLTPLLPQAKLGEVLKRKRSPLFGPQTTAIKAKSRT